MALLALAAVVVWLALNPLLHWGLIRAGQSLTGAKVDIGSLRTSVLTAHLEMRDVAVADPRREMSDWVQADHVSIDLDSGALLRKRLVMRDVRVSGIRFDADRATSGKLDPITPTDRDALIAPWRRFAARWAPLVAATARDQMRKEIEKLESVRLAQELKVRWPEEYEKLRTRADELQRRMEKARAVFEQPQDPMRALRLVEETAREIDTIRQEARALAEDVRRLGFQAQEDGKAVADAGRRDIDNLKQRFYLESFEADDLSRYLLGPELDYRVKDLIAWVEWVRKWVPTDAESLDRYSAERDRGIEIFFPGAKRYPIFWAQHMAIDGETTVAGKPYRFAGQITDVTSQPRWVGRPVVARFRLEGDTAYEAECVVDFTTSPPRERIVVNCPRVDLPSFQLGDEDQLALTVTPGAMHLWLEAEVTGDRLQARILAKQTGVHIAPHGRQLAGAERLVTRLRGALAQIDTVETVVLVSGPIESPAWAVRSNLGRDLSTALQTAVADELAEREQEMRRLAESRIDEELEGLRTTLSTKLAELDRVRHLLDDATNRLAGQATRALENHLPPGVAQHIPRDIARASQDLARLPQAMAQGFQQDVMNSAPSQEAIRRTLTNTLPQPVLRPY